DSITGGGVRATVDGHEVLIGKADMLAEQGVANIDSGRGKAMVHQSQGATVVFVSIDNELAAILAITDPIKASTPAAVRSLHDLGLKVVMLTGDAEPTAGAVAATLGIDEFHAGVSPQDKHAFVRRLRSEGRVVA